MSQHHCDIVLPVYNGLTYVRKCIDSLLEHTSSELYHLFIIDDCGDGTTSAYLQETVAKHPHFSLHRNEQNLGFVKSCNTGMKMGKAPFVLLLNSDVIVSPLWLETLLECTDQDEKIAAVNPLTNYASNLTLPMVPGLNFIDMNAYLRSFARRTAIDVVTSVGFCLLLRREALDAVGLFDEIYGHGYCEESDLAMRLTTAGWRTVVAPNCYVYHKGKATFTNRDERYLKNREIFDSRWAGKYHEQFRAFRKANGLAPIHHLFRTESTLAPLPSMRNTYRAMRLALQQRDFRRLAISAIRGLQALPHSRRPVMSATYFLRFKPAYSEQLRVTYVLPTLAVAGGVLSVIQLVNELILMGVDARIAALYEEPGIRDWPLLSEPILYASPKELIERFPPTDIVVATHWMTAQWVEQVVEEGKALKSVYFLQDYEAWFYPEKDTENRRKVKDTYAMISEKIVKSDWLAGMLAEDGYPTQKIRLGMNLDVFYPRAAAPHPVTIMAMARPSTPRRGYKYVVEALKRVKEKHPDVEIILFGDNIPKENLPFAAEITGPVTNQNELAALYSRADIFLDGSTFQGFGRPALEAMACGAACVLTDVGGVNEYASHEQNCLLVPPKEPKAFAEAILRLIDNPDFRAGLAKRALETVKDYCHRQEARVTLRHFQQLMSEPSKRIEDDGQ